MDGELRIHSQAGVGSTFSVELPFVRSPEEQLPHHHPRRDQPADPADQGMASARLAARDGRLRVLVAEDDPINQKVIINQLKRLDCAVDVAANGAEAYDYWQRNPYDLVLADLHMPEMDGYSLARAIRANEREDSHIPIFAFTANALKSEVANANQAGMDEYLTKPAPLATLRAMMEKWALKSAGEG